MKEEGPHNLPEPRRVSNPTLGLIFPLYNEEEVLPRLIAVLTDLDLGVPLSILFVDDGSSDRTLTMLQEACANDSRMACISLSRNFGQQAAITAALRHVRGDMVAILDGDLQDPPSLLVDFISKWREGYDVVNGIRARRQGPVLLRAAYKSFYWLFSKVSNIQVHRDVGDFALLDRRVVNALNAMGERNRLLRGLRSWVGFKQVGIPYHRPARTAGTTSYNTRRLVSMALDAILSFSTVPLRLASWTGATAALLGFVFLLFILGDYAFGSELPPDGWASTTVIVLFLGGIQLIVLGIIGEYLGRMFEEVKQRPHYFTQKKLGWVKEEEV